MARLMFSFAWYVLQTTCAKIALNMTVRAAVCLQQCFCSQDKELPRPLSMVLAQLSLATMPHNNFTRNSFTYNSLTHSSFTQSLFYHLHATHTHTQTHTNTHKQTNKQTAKLQVHFQVHQTVQYQSASSFHSRQSISHSTTSHSVSWVPSATWARLEPGLSQTIVWQCSRFSVLRSGVQSDSHI